MTTNNLWHDYANRLATQYITANVRNTPIAYGYLYALTELYECLSQSKRMKTQTGYVKRKIYEINLSYANGYFNTNKKEP